MRAEEKFGVNYSTDLIPILWPQPPASVIAGKIEGVGICSTIRCYSSAQVHQYSSLWDDSTIQRLIEDLIYRQIEFLFSNPYASAFRLTLRPNPPSADSLSSNHTQKGRNLRVAMHNYELDNLCYHLRLCYS